jgi:DNA-binding response OmpR family regulator
MDRNSEVYDDGYLRVEHDNYYVSCGGRPLSLAKKEFLIISRLVRNAGRVVPFREIWRYAWGEDLELSPASLRVHMHRLRATFSPFGLRIESQAGVGYKLSTGLTPSRPGNGTTPP